MQIYFKNKRFSSLSVIILLALSVLVVVVVAFAKEYIFPLKYFGDVITIENLINNPDLDTGDKGFMNTAIFFRVLPLDRYIITPIVTVLMYYIGVKKILTNYTINKISFINYTIITTYSAIAMVYMSTYSKDLILYIFVILSFIFLEKKNILIWTCIVLIYALIFRTYWIIIISSFWVLKLYFSKSLYKLTLYIVAFFIVIAFVFDQVLGISISSIREASNIFRSEDEAQTMISSYIEGDSFIDQGINGIVTLILFIIPIPLALFLKPFYILMFLLISFIFYKFIFFIKNNIQNKQYNNVISLVISMLVVQSIFEPDFGSFLRHLSPLYPLLFLSLAKQKNKLKNEN